MNLQFKKERRPIGRPWESCGRGRTRSATRRGRRRRSKRLAGRRRRRRRRHFRRRRDCRCRRRLQREDLRETEREGGDRWRRWWSPHHQGRRQLRRVSHDNSSSSIKIGTTGQTHHPQTQQQHPHQTTNALHFPQHQHELHLQHQHQHRPRQTPGAAPIGRKLHYKVGRGTRCGMRMRSRFTRSRGSNIYGIRRTRGWRGYRSL